MTLPTKIIIDFTNGPLDGAELTALYNGKRCWPDVTSEELDVIGAFEETDGGQLGRRFHISPDKPKAKYPFYKRIQHHGYEYELVTDYDHSLEFEYEIVEVLEGDGEVLFRAVAMDGGVRKTFVLVSTLRVSPPDFCADHICIVGG